MNKCKIYLQKQPMNNLDKELQPMNNYLTKVIEVYNGVPKFKTEVINFT